MKLINMIPSNLGTTTETRMVPEDTNTRENNAMKLTKEQRDKWQDKLNADDGIFTTIENLIDWICDDPEWGVPEGYWLQWSFKVERKLMKTEADDPLNP